MISRIFPAALLIILTIGSSTGRACADTKTAPRGPQRLAFVSVDNGGSAIYVMGADGSGLKRITRGLGDPYNLAWSRDGKRIAFSVPRDTHAVGAGCRLYVIGADGRGLAKVGNRLRAVDFEDWLPDGRITFSAHTRSGNTQTYVANPDGTGVKSATRKFGEVWSSDGKQVAYLHQSAPPNPASASEAVPLDVYVRAKSSRTGKRLTRLRAYLNDLSWSPDGTRLLFCSDEHLAKPGVYCVDIPRRRLKLLVIATRCSSPHWSPDGKRIVYLSESEIHVMDANGAHNHVRGVGGLQRFTPYLTAQWSRDSRHLVGHKWLGNSYVIELIDTVTSRVRVLPVIGSANADVVVSP